MADFHRQHGTQHQDIGRTHGYGHEGRHPADAAKSFLPENGPNKSQVLAIVTLLPVGGFLLLLAGLTLAGTVIGLTLATPLFVIFSPILVPAVITLGLAITGFLTSGAFGVTALSSISWIVNYLRGTNVSEQLEHGKWRAQDALGYAGQKAQDAVGYTGQKMKDAGQKTQDSVRT